MPELKTILLFVFSLCLSAQAQVFTLDGVALGDPASKFDWVTAESGTFERAGITIIVADSEVVGVSGERLRRDGELLFGLGNDGSKVDSTLGKPESSLFGCGPEYCEQIRFYKSLQLTVTTRPEVTNILLGRAAP